jgi:predicted ATPase
VPEILTTARNITARLAQFLSTSNLHQDQNSRIQNAYQTATRLSTFQPSSVRIVGLVGDSGVGKSSLINSLLDRAEFTRAVSLAWSIPFIAYKTDAGAKQSNSGTACTCVVTEYHFHDRDDYFIEIDYFTMQELRSQFKELLGAYRQYESPEPPDMPAADREDLRKNAVLAQSTFRASFRNKLDDHPEVLGTLPLREAIDTMMGWVEQVLPRLSTQENSLRESFSDINQCSNRLTVLASETDERDQAYPWPFIRKLKLVL